MLSSNNKIVQSKVDNLSKDFLISLSSNLNFSLAELSGAILRKFVFEFSQGSNEYNNLKSFVIENELKKR